MFPKTLLHFKNATRVSLVIGNLIFTTFTCPVVLAGNGDQIEQDESSITQDVVIPNLPFQEDWISIEGFSCKTAKNLERKLNPLLSQWVRERDDWQNKVYSTKTRPFAQLLMDIGFLYSSNHQLYESLDLLNTYFESTLGAKIILVHKQQKNLLVIEVHKIENEKHQLVQTLIFQASDIEKNKAATVRLIDKRHVRHDVNLEDLQSYMIYSLGARTCAEPKNEVSITDSDFANRNRRFDQHFDSGSESGTQFHSPSLRGESGL